MHGLKKLIRSHDSNSVELVILHCYLLMAIDTPTNRALRAHWRKCVVKPCTKPGPNRARIFQTMHGWQFSVNRRQTHPASRLHRGYVSRLALGV